MFTSAARSCPRRCAKKFRWRRPRHTLKGRQISAEVDRVGLRLKLLKQQAEAGDIVLLYGDESEALTHPYLARAWAKVGADLRVPAPGQAKKIAILGSLDHVTRRLIVHHQQDQEKQRLPRPSRTTRQAIWPKTRPAGQAGRPRRRQWSDPYQQDLAGGACRPKTLAHRRVVAQVRARTERHRTGLARPQGPSSGPSDLCRPRRPRPRNPQSRQQAQCRTNAASVGRTENLCLAGSG